MTDEKKKELKPIPIGSWQDKQDNFRKKYLNRAVKRRRAKKKGKEANEKEK